MTCPRSPTGRHLAAAATTEEGPAGAHDYQYRCIHCGVILTPETAQEQEPKAA